MSVEPEALKLESRPIPKPKRGEVLIRVKAFGLNRSELFTRQGHSPTVKFPRILGIEAVGVVEEAPGDGFNKGDVTVSNCDTRQSSQLEAVAWSSPQLIDWLQEIGSRLNRQHWSPSRRTELLRRPMCFRPAFTMRSGRVRAGLRTGSRRSRRLEGGDEVDGEFVVAGGRNHKAPSTERAARLFTERPRQRSRRSPRLRRRPTPRRMRGLIFAAVAAILAHPGRAFFPAIARQCR